MIVDVLKNMTLHSDLNGIEKDEDSSRRFKRNAERFAKKEVDVNNLMLKVCDFLASKKDFPTAF